MTEEEKAVAAIEAQICIAYDTGINLVCVPVKEIRTLLAAYERRGEVLEKAIKLLWDHCEGGMAPHIEELEAALNQETHHG